MVERAWEYRWLYRKRDEENSSRKQRREIEKRRKSNILEETSIYLRLNHFLKVNNLRLS